MARGWESKSVESQIEAAESRKIGPKQPALTAEQLRIREERDLLTARLSRATEDLKEATHQRYREQLRAAITDLEAQLKILEGAHPTRNELSNQTD